MAERALGDGLEVAGVDPPTGDGVAALAHTGVVAQPALVQVRVGQRVAARDPLGLDTNNHTSLTRTRTGEPPRSRKRPAPAHRVEDQHAAEQVNGLVGGAVRQHVEHRQRRLGRQNQAGSGDRF